MAEAPNSASGAPPTSLRICVSALLERNGRFLALRRSGQAVKRPAEWEIPGGTADFGEDPTEAVQRELAEETGLLGKAREVFGVASEVLHEAAQSIQKVELIFSVEDTGGEIELSDEHEAYDWVSIQDLPDTVPPSVISRLTDSTKR